MDNLRFVMESPQHSPTHKKRPRLVTSCDNCRLKKIKCVQSKDQERCESCESLQVSCLFRDRERYFAERSRIVTGGSTERPSSSASNHQRRSSTPATGQKDSYTSNRASFDGASDWYPSPAQPANSVAAHQSQRYAASSPNPYGSSGADMSYPSDSSDRRAQYVASPLSHTSGHSYSGNGYGTSALPSGLPQDPTTVYHNRSYSQGSSASPSPPLFDPHQPGVPQAAVMAQFIQIFFQRFGQNFPFLSSEDIQKRFYNGTLSPVLASSIAALASRYSQSSEIVSRGVSAVTEAYTNNTKRLLSSSSQVPYLEVLHAVIIIAWTEYKNGRTAGFFEYSQMATKMALNLGLGSDVAQTSSERERAMHRITWNSVAQLQQLTASMPGSSGSVGR
ncbi:uncharacterized protein STEHIDRAFT_150846 [Stereum hirsutum FP-91666 SS1]|uniref:Zn(2)-C6 fungal-type domain-containing protein n=1 Tax=Stereum hirsutum (strain FP-91666) TaxID=721885 RepID=R7RYU6_STEHR|nr:uncharacterized protein STEHIDRAFT_150846 [Stereum hirsutum FP-91666 SS1]EIM80003.1 hypothetical protein STEHIDRAFT_150846 [Stereum hirsutum FP-91666 SS1]